MITKILGVTAAAVALAAGGVAGTAQADPPPKKLSCVGKVVGGTYHHVKAPPVTASPARSG